MMTETPQEIHPFALPGFELQPAEQGGYSSLVRELEAACERVRYLRLATLSEHSWTGPLSLLKNLTLLEEKHREYEQRLNRLRLIGQIQGPHWHLLDELGALLHSFREALTLRGTPHQP